MQSVFLSPLLRWQEQLLVVSCPLLPLYSSYGESWVFFFIITFFLQVSKRI